MALQSGTISLYCFTPSGDTNLIEITTTDEGVTLTIGDSTFAFDTESAMDMADAIIEAAAECEELGDES